MKSFKKNLALIYGTKILAIITGFLTVLLVIPKLTSNPTIYGIYTICTSLGLFFSYADLGFLAACQKYAAEYFVQKNLRKEMKVIGFSLFILSLFVGVIVIFLFIIAYSPSLLIKSGSTVDLKIASQLILILVLFSPTIIIQKLNVLVYSIRIEDYIYQGIEIVFNLIKIGIIGLFVTSKTYDIIGYYLSIQVLSLISSLIAVYIIVRRYKYEILFLLKQFRFSKEVYLKTKDLAFSSLLLTIAWILYFELDTIILSKFYGIKVVAIYAVAVVFLNFMRTLYNTLFSPYLAYFYRFTAVHDDLGLNNAFSSLLKWTFPLIIIPPLVLVLYMEPIIFVWVGRVFEKSILISRYFILTISLTALSIPISYYMIAKSYNKIMRFTALTLPIVFYSSIILFDYIGLEEKALATATLTTISLNTLFNIAFIITIGGSGIKHLYFSLIKKIIIPILILLVIVYYIPPIQVLFKGDIEVYFKLGIIIFITTIVPLIVYYLLEKSTRKILTGLFSSK
ncbi:lipopolysaccharide biosynthesis protein [Chryseobacterium sp.]|uniref:lipopolysaccharide biosynthesis protein n=1 Tax=Chryseobacterium sp. TaxID=1871047 RepID=UPI0011C8932A|nr:oligosaccharide flippase family protein [Chryseobacterium sp.]TXF77526.1 oligosaccharide flippase family protein [Chryseobacterium sp.]